MAEPAIRRATWRSITMALLLAVAGCADAPGERTAAHPSDASGAITAVPLVSSGPAPAEGTPRFERLPAEVTGIDFENRFDWEHERRHLFTHGYAGGGVAIGDIDGDDRPDVYLVSQTGRDRLFRQVGDLRFEDVTDRAGVGNDAWGTGAVFADVDGDADLDLYVCNYDAPNRLYLNRGDGTFVESAAERGLAFDGASVMAGFADYDLDGDLDVYLVTNRLYPGPGRDEPRTRQVDGKVAIAPEDAEAFAIQERVIDGAVQKFVVKAGQGDRLYRNRGDGTFEDASAVAGISGNHPGLAATWWDYDRDGRPDLYVSNDFWDPDRLYRNEGDGTFRDVLASTLPHTPWFSMGADFGDVDGDGRLDLLAADMSATTHYRAKIMMGDMNDSRWFLVSAEPRQYMRNALFLNTGTERFMEVAYLANLASTDWTWSVKFGDFDNDRRLDLFATNGTANRSFDPDLTRELRTLERQQNRVGLRDPVARWEQQWRLYRREPPQREVNKAFRNVADLAFEDVGAAWGLDHEGISFGAATADLDRDGDLDLVVSNVDDAVGVYRNRGGPGRGALVRLRGERSNRFGLGAMVTVETGAEAQVRYLAPTRGYMSSNEPALHFGLGSATRIDRLTVEWPSGHVQAFADLPVGHAFTITEPAGPPPPRVEPSRPVTQFTEIAAEVGLDTGPVPERPYDDYRRQPLLPGQHSQLGPGLAWGDADGDGDEDLFIGGPAGTAGRLLVNQGDGRFASRSGPWIVDGDREDMAILWLDADRDGDRDLYVASGGVECEPGSMRLRDRLYLNDGAGGFTRASPDALPDAVDSSSAVAAADVDADGDLDLFVGARLVPGAYPVTPVSRLLRNDDGRFVDVTPSLAPGLDAVGLVTAALFSDADGDGRPDLLVATEWGPVAYWRNTAEGFVDQTEAVGLAGRLGWWNGLAGADLDGDGDLDYVVTNAGLNTKYAASPEKPAHLFYGDFDGSGQARLVEAKPGAEALLPVRGRSCSSSAMPMVARRMPTYHDFASASLEEIYSAPRLAEALTLTATELASGVLMNERDADGRHRFVFRPLPRLAQAAPGFGVAATDFDGDTHVDVYVVQNLFSREPETGRWDGGLSLLLRGDGTGTLTPVGPAASGLVVAGDAKGLGVTDLDDDGRPDVAVTQNDDRLLVFRNAGGGGTGLAVRLRGTAGNVDAVGARVTAVTADGRRQTAEVHAGAGYLSQSSPRVFFGHGDAGIRRLHVQWPDGLTSAHPVDPGAARLVIDRATLDGHAARSSTTREPDRKE